MRKPVLESQPKIVIIGGGAAGLSAGFFLKKRGYTNVTILEKENRIGGKCLSLTVHGKSFDLGANYVTSSYREVHKLARMFNANLYTEGKLRAFDTQTNRFSSLFRAVTKNKSLLSLGWKSIKYLYKRWRINRFISPKRPGYAGIAQHPELTQSFGDWLQENGLSDLEVLFEVPVSLMGYGKLREIPAAYALTYMTNHTFLDLMLAAVNPAIRGYPQRFTEGYQRLWERVSWELDVRVGAKVTKVVRGEKIRIHYEATEEILDHEQTARQYMECDYVFIATPLYLDALKPFLDLSTEENDLFEKVLIDPFVVTTYYVPGLEDFTAATFMIPEPHIGQPFVITRQFADNNLVSIYTRTLDYQDSDKEKILKTNREFIKKSLGIELGHYYTYSVFPYFPHVPVEVFANNFYDQLEALQGHNQTFYVGGLMNFELVETITNYSKHLVKNNFPNI